MSKHASPTVVGTFTIVALALLFGVIMLLGGSHYFHRTARVIVYFDTSVAGLTVGAPVKFRGIEIGTVKDMRINVRGAVFDPHNIRIPVLLQIDESRLNAQGIFDVDLRDRAQVNRLVALGLRATLETDSLLTGVMYVALDVQPGTPARLVHDPTYPEIPPLRSPREEIPEKLGVLLTKLADVNFTELASSLQATVAAADRLLSSPHLAQAVSRLDALIARVDTLTRHLDVAARHVGPALADLRGTAASIHQDVAPGGRLSSQLENTLHELELAARSVRRLSDQLSRDPGSLLRGGKP